MRLCVAEHEVPETLIYGAFVEKKGGICKPNSTKVVSELLRRYGGKLRDFTQKEPFELSGACLDYCVGWLAISLLARYDAQNVIVDLPNSYGIVERVDHRGKRSVLGINERMELFKNSHMDWEIFGDKLRFKK